MINETIDMSDESSDLSNKKDIRMTETPNHILDQNPREKNKNE